jgi:quercetin dioxygenase-like cupin family protein
VKGLVTLTLGDEETDLGPGDAVTLPARAPRRWQNHTGGTAEILIVAARARGEPGRA